MRLDDFDYELPADRIASLPPARRGDSRLLVLDRRSGERTDAWFRDLPRWLGPGDLLVRNDTRVFPARLHGCRANGGRVEILLVRAAAAETAEAAGLERSDQRIEAEARAAAAETAGAAEAQEWLCLVRPGKRLRRGERADLGRGVEAEWVGEPEGGGLRRVRFHGVGDVLTFAESSGEIPLPPYIRREAEPADRERYQTVYARRTGAVAAPTAGLHFTEEIFAELAAGGVDTVDLTLHVGPGTFLPIRADDVDRHRMHAEWTEVSPRVAETIARARANGGRIVAVGTTVVRALEGRSRSGRLEAGDGDVDLFLRPGDVFHTTDALITNFHLPRSTLLVLVCAFAGRAATLAAYRHALENRYRFYSYGDAMLIV